MSRPCPRPRRPLRNELLSLSLVLLLPIALATLFPYRALMMQGQAGPLPTPPSCVFVELGPGAEARAFDVVQSVFSVDSGQVRSLREDLLLSPLPEEEAMPLLGPSDRSQLPPMPPLAYEAALLPPSLAAAGPECLDSVASPPALPVFPREELLKID